MKKYKLLSLDGGGVWSYIQLCALEKLYQQKLSKEEITGHEILNDFDLVVANSGGSLVLLALATNKTLRELKSILEKQENRALIFKKKGLTEQMLLISLLAKAGLSPKYKMKSKREGLEEIFKKRTE